MIAIGPDAATSRFPGRHTCRARVSRSRRSARRARTPVCAQRPTYGTRPIRQYLQISLGEHPGGAASDCSTTVGLRTNCGNVSVAQPRCGFGFDRGSSPSGAELIIDGLGNFHRNSMSCAELRARADAIDQFRSPLFKCGQGAYRPSADCRHDPAAHESSDKR